jgi:hypothetical protein
MTPRKKKIVDEPTIEQFQKEAEIWNKWDELRKSHHGTFLLEQLDLAISETLDSEDKTDIYKIDQQAREYFFASVRSKRQTLKALKDKLLKAEEERSWRVRELSKLVTEEAK